MKKPDNYASRPLRLPDWLVSEEGSAAGAELRREWIAAAKKSPDARSGQSRLASAMLMMRDQRPARPLLGRANARALRWVDARARASRAASALSAVTPNLPWAQRLASRLNALTVPAMAAMLVVLCRTGLLGAVDGLFRVGGRLARLHEDRHIWPSA
jgi:hypothetical protein